MTRISRIASFGVAAALSVVLAGAGPFAGPGPVTVGQFIDRIATAVGPATTAVASMKGAATQLSTPARWADLDMNAPLTFGTVSRIASDLGIPAIPPANPNAIVSPAQAGVIAGLIVASHGVEGVALTPDDLPDQCLSSENRGHCVDCCKAASGQGGQFCGRFCHSNVPPPPSPGEPQP